MCQSRIKKEINISRVQSAFSSSQDYLDLRNNGLEQISTMSSMYSPTLLWMGKDKRGNYADPQ